MNTWTEKAKASFWEKVDKSAGEDGCWPWMRSRMTTGYGQVNMGTHSKSLRAHRVAYELAYGPIPPGGRGKHGTCVLHSCDNRLCCNPKHLRHGTQLENIQEAYRKGRIRTPQANDAEVKRRSAAYPELVEALRELVTRCDGAEGVRADGSNIQTHNAHGLLAKLGEA